MIDKIVDPNWQLPPAFHFTQSNLQDFVDCERRFYLRHIAQQRWPSPLAEPQDEVERALSRGSRFHQLVERHQRGVEMDILRESIIDDAVIGDWLDRYEAALAELGPFEQRWVEASLSTRVANKPVLAKYDFIGRKENTLVGIDWKTGRLPDVQRLQERMQTVIYLLVLFREGARLAGQEIDNFALYYVSVNDGETRHFTVNAQDAHRLATQLQGVIEEVIHARDFPLTEDIWKCKYCLYRGLCERGTSPNLNDDDISPDDFWLDFGVTVDEIEF
ncbi:MAG: PD-(D/E)XK nuclease family protein [Chloroflexi bacterium]|nr:PD-(D/E)XK nuclease family protein [Chloroflexota bacterium]